MVSPDSVVIQKGPRWFSRKTKQKNVGKPDEVHSLFLLEKLCI